MKVATLKDVSLVSSDVSESLYSEYDYSGSTSYNSTDRVYVSYESDGVTERTPHKIYEATATTTTYPPENPANWSDLGATNRWKMFDGSPTSQTIATDTDIIVEIDSSDSNVIGVLNLDATSIEIAQISNTELLIDGDCSTDSFIKGVGWTYGALEYNCSGTQVADSILAQSKFLEHGFHYQVTFTVSNYSAGSIAGYVGGIAGDPVTANGTYQQIIEAGTTDELQGVVADLDFIGTVDDLSVLFLPKYEMIGLGSFSVADYYEYFFDEVEYKSDLVWYYPQYGNSTIRITISDTLPECGLVVIGRSADIGLTQYRPTVGIIDYSIKSTDNFGNTILSQGAFAKRADVEFDLIQPEVDSLQIRLAGLRGIPALYDCNNDDSDFESLLIYGYYEKFDVVIPNFSFSTCNIRIQGLS
jgi:hypothetical protein